MLHKLKPKQINDRPSSKAQLESWMLFPNNDKRDKSLRWAHCQKSSLNEFQNQLYQLAVDAKDAKDAKDFDDSPRKQPKYLEIVPREIVPTEFLVITPTDLAIILERPVEYCSKLAKKNSADALVAGLLLIYMRLLDIKKPVKHASFSTAKIIASKQHESNRSNIKQSSKSIEPRTDFCAGVLDVIWRDFSKVAHLWAAYHTLRGFSSEPTDNPLNGINIRDLIAIAEIYRNCGENFFSKPANKTLYRNHPFNFYSFEYSGKLPEVTFSALNLPCDDIFMTHIHNACASG